MPNTYTEKIMVASGVPFTPDEEHPYPPNPEEVEFETIPSGGGSGTDLDSLDLSTNESSDDDLFVTKEDGGTAWVKKSFLKIWNYISLKLGIFIGTSATWEAKTQEEKDLYNLEFITDDSLNGTLPTAYEVPYNSTSVGNALDTSGTVTNYTLTAKNNTDLSGLEVYKEANGIKHINGWVKITTAIAAGNGLELAELPVEMRGNATGYTFSVGYAYNDYSTCLIYENGSHNLELYKTEKALAANAYIAINASYI